MCTRLIALLAVVTIAGTTIGKGNTSYVYNRGDKSYIQSRGSLDSVLRVAKRWDGEFIWFSRDGRGYLIRDAASLAEARAAFRELDALQPSHEVIAKKLEPLHRREQVIEEQLDAITDTDENVDEAKRRELEKKMRDVEAQLRKVEKEMEQLERKMDALEQVAEKRLQQIVDRAIRNGVAKRVD